MIEITPTPATPAAPHFPELNANARERWDALTPEDKALWRKFLKMRSGPDAGVWEVDGSNKPVRRLSEDRAEGVRANRRWNALVAEFGLPRGYPDPDGRMISDEDRSISATNAAPNVTDAVSFRTAYPIELPGVNHDEVGAVRLSSGEVQVARFSRSRDKSKKPAVRIISPKLKDGDSWSLLDRRNGNKDYVWKSADGIFELAAVQNAATEPVRTLRNNQPQGQAPTQNTPQGMAQVHNAPQQPQAGVQAQAPVQNPGQPQQPQQQPQQPHQPQQRQQQQQQPQQPQQGQQQPQGQNAVPAGPAAAAVQPQAPGVAAGAEPTPQQLQEQLRQLQEQLTRVQTESAQLTQREVDTAERRAREQYGALALASLDALGITDPVARDTLVNTFKQFPVVAERPNPANDATITAENTTIRERNERNRQVREVFAKRRWKIWQKAQRVSDEMGLKAVGEAVLQDQRQPWWKKLGVDGAITGAFMGTGLGYGAWAALGALGCLGSIAATPFVAVGAGAVGGYRFMRRGLDRDNAIGRGNSFMHRNPTVSAAVFGALCGYDAGMLSNPVVRSDMAGFFGKLVGNIQSSIGSLFQLVAGTRLPLPPGVSISI